MIKITAKEKHTMDSMDKKQISFSQYRGADLTIFFLITVAAEAVIGIAATKWFPEQPFSITLVYAMTSLVMMRWGAPALLIAAADSLTYCIVCGGAPKQFVVYTCGACFALVVLLLNKFVGKQKIRDSYILSSFYALAVFVSVIVGRGVFSLIYGDPLSTFTTLAATDALSAVFAIVVVLICRRQDGLFEDQRHYLIRTDEARKKALRGSTTEDETQYQPIPQEMGKTDDCEIHQ